MSSANGLLLCKLARLSKKVLIPLFSILTLLLSFNTLAANGPDNTGRADYDLDDNGLIEINDLADLDEIRNNLDGKTLYGSNAGCPNAEDGTVNGGCIGFELKADLDFDTSGDGIVGEFDDYRNVNQQGIAEGWEPIGDSYPNYFTAHFNGNGHIIKNLTINRPSAYYVGLFGLVKDSTIENLAIAGLNSEVAGDSYVAALVGYAESNTHIRNVLVAANVQSNLFAAGLVGWVKAGVHIENCFVSGSVSGDSYVAGLVGWSEGSSNLKNSINQSLSTSSISGNSSVGGLVAYQNNTDITNSYWAKDASGQNNSHGSSEASSYVGLNLATLQCAIAENSDSTTECVSDDGSAEDLNAAVVLYKDWNPEVWDFGIAPNADQQLPGLKFNVLVFRDSDGDGSLDEDDVWPNNRAVSQDLDADGYPDAWSLSCDDACIVASGLTLDQFPHHAWAVVDADFDGLPDGTENCVSNCQLDGLTKDGALGDYDNDGILDADDPDENNDGINDIDANHNGLIDIDSLDRLNAMRFQLQGGGLQLTDISDVESSGCPRILFQGAYQQRCSGYELTQSLNFDTNGNGEIDNGDAYWNVNAQGVGEGWLPVGIYNDGYKKTHYPFNAQFNGNGYVINNLTINRPNTSYVGLFGFIQNSKIENLAIAGVHSSVIGFNKVGALVGSAENSQISTIFIGANVQGNIMVAGLVGLIGEATHIEKSFVSGSVSGYRNVAGLVGSAVTQNINIKNSISQSLSTSNVSGGINVGGGVGYAVNTDVINSYWAKDGSGQVDSAGSSEANSYVGLNLMTLQCATAENTDSSSGCVSVDGSAEGLSEALVLYKNWDPVIWDFGIAPDASKQLPGLKFNGQVLRDSDGDGVFDEDDSWPNNRAASQDIDADGYPDKWSLGCDYACILASGLSLDGFPLLAGAWLDADHDGLIDEINPSCTSGCDIPVGLLDTSKSDYDNDGILDAEDTDENNDGTDDIDADHDGLIDIDSLDKLNAMRFQLQGIGLQLTDESLLEVSGCPFVIYQGTYQQRCAGYELTKNLDFDTSGNGVIDSGDAYWNVNDQGVGEGWLPVGGNDINNSFSTYFNGNGYAIKNLTINRPKTEYVGLFGVIENARVESLAIAGVHSSITGNDRVGALVGYAKTSQIRNIAIAANVQGQDSVAGLVGYLDNGSVENSFSSGSVSGDTSIGGLVSSSGWGSSISQSLSTSIVTGNKHTGGIIGRADYAEIINSYWAKDTSTQFESSRSSESNSYVGLSLAKLQCAIAENTDSSTGCVSVDGGGEGLNAAMVLYKDWDPAIWDFGTEPNVSQQLPGLKLNGLVLRDGDSDGVLDQDDKWPNNRAASQDFDEDGYPDAWSQGCDDVCIQNSGLILDQFPRHAWAAVDADFDGFPDDAENCVNNCQLDGLTKDSALGDHDNDGILDVVDTDENNDGIDDVDADHDGLIDIDSLEKLNAMRFQLQGAGLQLTDISSVEVSGCPFIIHQGVYLQRCSGYELTQDLDFDTNRNGEIDSGDDYWNINGQGVGEGWSPIGVYDTGYFKRHTPFNSQFDGNGYAIKNLTINRPEADAVGLFGYIQGAKVENLAIVSARSAVIGSESVGALVGIANNSLIRNIAISAEVQGYLYVGGLAGEIGESTLIENGFVSGSVSGYRYIGGLVGYLRKTHSYTKNSIIGSLSTSIILDDGRSGGLVGYGDYDDDTDVINSYWARDVSGQSNSKGFSEANSYVGLNLAKLQCAIAENTDSSTGCVSVDGNDEGLASAMVLFNDWDPAIWYFGNENQLPGLIIKNVLYQDSDGDGLFDLEDVMAFDYDNDGVLDVADYYPLISLSGALDSDGDGIPNNCDQACLDLGMIADIDNDNDGVIDEEDFYPLIAVGSLDTDHDGIPNDCNQACLDLDMVADTDDDNDGVLDGADFYPLISLSGALDSDGDGIPDECNQACLDSGMVADTVDSIDSDNDGVFDEVDAFASNPAASIDDDNDGQPDRWNDACLTQCQADSGLVKDPSLNDTDNDGATNDVDSDFENDNGKPTLLTVPETMYAAVNTNDGSGFIVDPITVDSLLSQLTAVDFVDEPSALTAKAYLNNVELVRNENGEITLPSGLLALNWVALDSSGNESEPLEQLVYVYPQVRFKSATSITGEASQAEIIVELTGDSPEYPISIDLQVNSDLSSIDQADLNVSFDLAAMHRVVIEAGDDAELLNREASLIIPIIEDDESENDELLVIEFPFVVGDQDYHEFIVVSENQKAHELTVTYRNLAPSVQLLVLQDEQAVTSIAMDGGAVTLLAVVSDGNGFDEHTYSWDLDGLITEDLSVSTITFEPSDFAAREYLVSVTVTDNASNPLSGMASQKLILLAVEEPPIIEPPVTEPPANPSSGEEASSGGSSGGGAMGWMLLLLMTLAVLGQYRRYARAVE